MFSVVIPLWNKRHTVAATLAGAMAQTWRDFELILVDDGSTDGGMAETLRFDDPRIRRLTQANAGPGAARNSGIRAARGEWIAFLDADDIWFPDHLAELDRVRRRFPDAGLIGTTVLRSDRQGRYRTPARSEGRIESVNFFDLVNQGRWPVTTSSAAIPRRTFEALGGFGDAPCGQDIEFWTRIALDRPIAVSSRATAVYILGTGGICDTVLSPCLGRELRHWGDICPSMGLLRDRQGEIGASGLRQAIDRFIDRQFRYTARNAARIGDLRTLRMLPRLYLRPPPLSDWLLLTLARAPAPVARAGFALGLRLKALLRALRLDRKSRAASSSGTARASGNVAAEARHHVAEQAPC